VPLAGGRLGARVEVRLRQDGPYSPPLGLKAAVMELPPGLPDRGQHLHTSAGRPSS
jgi:hypothetical protein